MLPLFVNFHLDSKWSIDQNCMYTYAFFKTSGVTLSLSEGIAGTIQVVQTPVLSAMVEPGLDLDAIQADDNQLVQAVLTHDRVICQLFWQMTILPLRFGTQFVSEAGLLSHLEAHQESYLAKLNQLEGKAEHRLRLTPIELDDFNFPNEDLTGKAYFFAEKQLYPDQADRRVQQQQEIQRLLKSITQYYPNYHMIESSEDVEKIYLLVDRQAEMTLYEHVKEWQQHCPSWDLELGEALPPYHFV